MDSLASLASVLCVSQFRDMLQPFKFGSLRELWVCSYRSSLPVVRRQGLYARLSVYLSLSAGLTGDAPEAGTIRECSRGGDRYGARTGRAYEEWHQSAAPGKPVLRGLPDSVHVMAKEMQSARSISRGVTSCRKPLRTAHHSQQSVVRATSRIGVSWCYGSVTGPGQQHTDLADLAKRDRYDRLFVCDSPFVHSIVHLEDV